MMNLIAIRRADGGVSVMQMMPVRIVRGIDNAAFMVDRVVRTADGSYAISAVRSIGSNGQQEILRGYRLSEPQLRGAEPMPEGFSLAFDADAEVAKWKESHPGEYVSHHAIDEADVPTDRTYRNAWISDGRKISHDMAKARALHRELMRRARAPKLAALDVEYQRADEAGDAAAKKDIAARKKELRDVTRHAGIDAAATVDQLKAVWPAALK